MPLKSFCDLCGTPATKNRRDFSDVPTKNKEIKTGLGVTVMFNGRANPDNFICDECFAGLLIEAVRTTPTKAADFLDNAEESEHLRAELAARTDELSAKQRLLDKTLTVYEERIAKQQTRMQEDANEIATLADQVLSLQQTAEKRLREQQQLQSQEEIDQLENPVYQESKLRRGAKKK